MISENIKKMFLFIDFLYDNIENFKQYDSIVDDTVELSREYQKLEPKKYSVHDKRSKEIKALHEANTVKINQSIRQPITDKLIELGLKKDNDCIDLFTDIDALKINYEVIDECQVKVKHNKWNTVMLEIKDKWLFYTANEFSFFCEFDSAVNHLFSFFSEPKPQPEAVEQSPPLPITKHKDIDETPKTFEQLFYNIELVTPCIDILKELNPPLIDTEYNYIGKLKGIVCVWIDELQRQGIVKGNYPEERKLFASLIPQKIKRFSIDESMFGKYQSKAENNYRTDIKTKVSKIKLSQNSQNSH